MCLVLCLIHGEWGAIIISFVGLCLPAYIYVEVFVFHTSTFLVCMEANVAESSDSNGGGGWNNS